MDTEEPFLMAALTNWKLVSKGLADLMAVTNPLN